MCMVLCKNIIVCIILFNVYSKSQALIFILIFLELPLIKFNIEGPRRFCKKRRVFHYHYRKWKSLSLLFYPRTFLLFKNFFLATIIWTPQICQNTGKRKPIFWHVLRTARFPLKLLYWCRCTQYLQKCFYNRFLVNIWNWTQMISG